MRLPTMPGAVILAAAILSGASDGGVSRAGMGDDDEAAGAGATPGTAPGRC